MLRKILSCITLILLINSHINYSFSEYGKTNKNSLLELFWEEKWYKVIKTIDTYTDKISKKEENFLLFLEKISEKNNAFLEKGSEKKDEKKAALLWYILEHWYEEYIKNHSKVRNTLLESEKKEIEKSILWLQKYIFQNTQEMNFNSSKWIEMKGNLNSQIHINWDYFWEIAANFQLNNLWARVKWANSETSGNMKLSITSSGITNNLSSDFTVIQKDGEQFMKVENLTSDGNEEDQFSKEIVAFLEKIQGKKSFVRTVSWRDEVTELIENFQHTAPVLYSRIQTEALFIGYKKVGKKTQLIPSQFMCNLGKELFEGNKEACSQSEYNTFLDTFLKTKLLFTLEKNGENDLYRLSWYEYNTHIYGKLEFSNTGIQEFQLSIIPSQRDYKNQGISLIYNGKDTLDIKVKIENTNFWARLLWDIKNYKGEYAISSYGMWVIQWNFKQIINWENQIFSLSFKGEKIWWEEDSLEWDIQINVENKSKFWLDVKASYKQSNEEVFWGNLYYTIDIQEKDLEIKAPEIWIDWETLDY